jgi:mono/diheme cytochrome c family protein
MKTRSWVAIFALVGIAMLTLPAVAQDVQMGYIVAQRSCSSCHEIEQGRFRSDVRPSFATIASRPNTTMMSLEILLTNPHYRMPDYLTRQEIADVSAYILSLK